MAAILRRMALAALLACCAAAAPGRALDGETEIEVLLINIKPFDATFCFRIAPSDGNGNPSSDFEFVEEPLAFGDRTHGTLPPTAAIFVAEIFLFTGDDDAICEATTVGDAAIEAGEWRTASLGFVSNSVAISFDPDADDSASNAVLVDFTNFDQSPGTNEFKYLNYAIGFGDCEFTVVSDGDTDSNTNSYTLSNFGASSVLDRECRDVDLTQINTQLTCEQSANRGTVFQERDDFCLNGQNLYVAAGIQGNTDFPLQLFSYNSASECQMECLTVASPEDDDSDGQDFSNGVWFAVIVCPVIAVLLCAVAGCWWCGCFVAPPEDEDEEYEEEFDEEARRQEKSGLVAMSELKEDPGDHEEL